MNGRPCAEAVASATALGGLTCRVRLRGGFLGASRSPPRRVFKAPARQGHGSKPTGRDGRGAQATAAHTPQHPHPNWTRRRVCRCATAEPPFRLALTSEPHTAEERGIVEGACRWEDPLLLSA